MEGTSQDSTVCGIVNQNRNNMKAHTIENFLLIIGSMKCGTTSLFNQLAEHPEISPCKEKEPDFFSNQNIYKKGFDFYQSLWNYSTQNNAIALEASTNYSKAPRVTNTPDRIYKVKSDSNTNFKFIYVIRNPIDRIISHCTHDLQAQWSVKYNHPIVNGIPYPAIEISKYAMQLATYLELFPRKDILILDFEDLKNNTEELLKKICIFLEIDPAFEFRNISKRHNQSSGKMKTNELWPTFDKYIASPVISCLAPEKKRKARKKIRKLFEVDKIQEKVKLSEFQYDFLVKELRDDLYKLRTEYGVDISKWNLEV